MLLVLAFAAVVLWVLGFTVFHVAGAAIHLLLILAAGIAVLHLVRAASTHRVA